MPASRNKVTAKSISAILSKWRPLLGIDGRWDINVRIYTDGETWPHEGAAAAVRSMPGYFQASLHLDAKACEEDADTLEHIILHELVHIVLWPLSVMARNGLGDDHEESFRDTNEAATEQLTRALLRKRAK
jgi:hypothetical protein